MAKLGYFIFALTFVTVAYASLPEPRKLAALKVVVPRRETPGLVCEPDIPCTEETEEDDCPSHCACGEDDTCSLKECYHEGGCTVEPDSCPFHCYCRPGINLCDERVYEEPEEESDEEVIR